MDSQLLISYPNQVGAQRPFCFGTLNDSGGMHWVRSGATRKQDLGVTGFTAHGSNVFVIVQSKKRPKVVAMDPKDWSIRNTYFLTEVIDPHCLVSHRGDLYVASTGNNGVYRLKLENDVVIGEENVWQFPDTSRTTDDVHLNSIAFVDDALVVSSFGPRDANGEWAANGSILLTESGQVLAGNLVHPHSIKYGHGVLAFAESNASQVHIGSRDEAGAFQFRKVPVPGYPRGILLEESNLLVGSSARRKTSKSTGRQLDVGDASTVHSGVYRIDLESDKTQQVFDTSAYATEIYELAQIDCAMPVNKNRPFSLSWMEYLRVAVERRV
jgi:hypothetical protein